MPVVILAAGDGTRMAGVTGDGPKCLLDVQGKPFIVRQLEWLAETWIDDVTIWVNERDERAVRRATMNDYVWPFDLDVQSEDVRSGTGGALQAVDTDAGEVVAIMGDVMLDAPLPRLTLKRDKRYRLACILVTDNAGPEDKKNVSVTEDTVTAYVRTGGREYVDCGVWLVRLPVTDCVGCAGSMGGYLESPWDVEDVFFTAYTEPHQQYIGAVVTHAYQWHIGNPEGYERMCRDWRLTQ